MSLRDGAKKMSKSDPSDYSRINLTDDADAIAQKVRKAKTDPEPLPSEEKGLEGRPEAENLVGDLCGARPTRRGGRAARAWRRQFSAFKTALVDVAVDKLAPLAGEMRRLMADPGHIDAILVEGADRARAIARPTIDAVKDIVGFVRRRLRPACSAGRSPGQHAARREGQVVERQAAAILRDRPPAEIHGGRWTRRRNAPGRCISRPGAPAAPGRAC